MSREIDPSKPLSESDRQYLLARGCEEQVASIDARQAEEDSDDLEVPTELVVDDEEPYEDMTLAALQDECRSRQRPVGGTKQQLVSRLEEDDARRVAQA